MTCRKARKLMPLAAGDDLADDRHDLTCLGKVVAPTALINLVGRVLAQDDARPDGDLWGAEVVVALLVDVPA